MKELVHLDGGKLSFSMAVVRVADALSPLAAARDITASIGACVVEIAQIDLERKRLHARGQALSAYLVQRQREVSEVFAVQRIQAGRIEVDRQQVREALRVVVAQSTDRHVPEDERQIFAGLIPVLSGQLVAAARDDREGLVALISAMNLGGYVRRVEEW